MEEILVNTNISGAQMMQQHIEIEDGHIICWVSREHNNISGQKFNFDLNKIGEEFILTELSVPNYPNLFKTNEGFGLIFHPNNGQIYVKLFDIDCNVIAEEKQINTLINHSVQSDNQKAGVEVNDGYLIIWASPGEGVPTNKSEIYAQKIDKELNSIGEQFMVNDISPKYSKYNPSAIKTDFGYIICWGMWTQDENENWGTQILLKSFTDEGVQTNNTMIINKQLSVSSRYTRINKIDNGYSILWKAGYTDVYMQKISEDIVIQGETIHINGTSIRNANVTNNEFSVGSYQSSSQDVVLQRYDLEGNTIDEEFTVNDPNDCYDDGIFISPIFRGYIIMWNSVKLNDNYEVYVKKYIYGDETNIMEGDSIKIDNSIRFTMFKNNIEDLLNDVLKLENVYNQMNEWGNNGIQVNLSIEPVLKQKENLIIKIEEYINQFKDIFFKLKEHDDRIVNQDDLTFDESEYVDFEIEDKVNYLCQLYKKLHTNIKEDIDKLDSINDEISIYNNLGIKLGNATEIISEQKKILEGSIIESSQYFDKIITKSCEEKEKIN